MKTIIPLLTAPSTIFLRMRMLIINTSFAYPLTRALLFYLDRIVVRQGKDR